MSLVVGVDLSTTACKAVAFDAAGSEVAEGRAALRLEQVGRDGWEQDAEGWWSAMTSALAELTRALGPRSGDVRGLAIACQRETFVVTDEEARPLHRAITWLDARCSAQVERAVRELGRERLHALTGKPPCVTPSLYKLAFLLEQAPALRARRLRVLDVHGFLAWRLTGRPATSLASADPLGVIDLEGRDWSDPLLEWLGLPRSAWPELEEPGALLGPLLPDVARATGLPPGLPIIAGAGDGQAAGLGAGVTDRGRVYLNLGTALVAGVPSRTPARDPAFRTLLSAVRGEYFLETDLKGGTFTVTWLIERLLGRTGDVVRHIGALEREAAALPAGADGLVIVPYLNGVMNPYWDDAARGIVVGLRGSHGPAHFLRAVYEGLALEQRLHLDGVERAVGTPLGEVVLLGGGSRSELLTAIVRDALGRPLRAAGTPEATALGAAVLAAVGVGVHADVTVAALAMTRQGPVQLPGPDAARYARLFGGYTQLYPALRAPLSQLGAVP